MTRFHTEVEKFDSDNAHQVERLLDKKVAMQYAHSALVAYNNNVPIEDVIDGKIAWLLTYYASCSFQHISITSVVCLKVKMEIAGNVAKRSRYWMIVVQEAVNNDGDWVQHEYLYPDKTLFHIVADEGARIHRQSDGVGFWLWADRIWKKNNMVAVQV